MDWPETHMLASYCGSATKSRVEGTVCRYTLSVLWRSLAGTLRMAKDFVIACLECGIDNVGAVTSSHIFTVEGSQSFSAEQIFRVWVRQIGDQPVPSFISAMTPARHAAILV